MRYAAKVAYDGTDYAGFQRQKNAPSVQQALEEALSKIYDQSVRVIGAGRTDAGVHATGQVIAFDLDWRHSPVELRSALNARLPHDIAVREVWQASTNFHPRFDATRRTYRYRIVCGIVRDPLRRRDTWQMVGPLDVGLMNQAADCLIGTHDFTSFGLPPRGDNAVREVYQARWEQAAVDEIRFTITANAFLFRMVRTLVASMAQVGKLRMTVDEFCAILAARQRGVAVAPAPACGLTLIDVQY